MSQPQQGQRIVVLVRALVGLGLMMVAITLGLIGWTLTRVRVERALASAEQEQLNHVSDDLRQRAADCRSEIQAVLDETQSLPSRLHAVYSLIELISSQSAQIQVGVRSDSEQLTPLIMRIAENSRRVQQWRASYDKVWQDVSEQHSLGQARALITQLRGAVDELEGRRRLDEAIKHRRWRRATSDASLALARDILQDQGREQSQGVNDFKSELAECARLVELLGGEEQIDSLADLKDNKLKPSLDRLTRTITAFGAGSTGAGLLTPQAIEQLKALLFGAGPNDGGLFTLRHDALRLRREREKMKMEIAALFLDIERANDDFAQSVQARSATLTQQMEGGLEAGWHRMLYLGVGSSALFLWLAWMISRGIGGQVNALDSARALAVQENAERRQAEEALRKNEAQLQTIVENLAEGVAVFDLGGQLLHFNQAALAMHGIGSLKESRRQLSEFAVTFELSEMNGTGIPLERWPLSRVLRGENLRDLEIRVLHREAGWERVFSYGGSLVHDPEGRPLMAIVTIRDVTERKKAEAELTKTQKELLKTSRLAGMAEVATGVLHNVGNVLNSVNVSATLVTDMVKKSRSDSLAKVVKMLRVHDADLGAFITLDPKGKQVPAFLGTLAEHHAKEQNVLLKELANLQQNIEHIKEVVSMQQSFARVSGVIEKVEVSELIEDALRMNVSSLVRHDIEVVRQFPEASTIEVDKHKVLQILVNLVRNAKHACDESGREDKKLTLRVETDVERVRISVSDNGVGIPADNLNRIFNHGFTTKKDGHGFGLHSGANAAKELGGSLTVHSDGTGRGATFIVELPLEPAKKLSA